MSIPFCPESRISLIKLIIFFQVLLKYNSYAFVFLKGNNKTDFLDSSFWGTYWNISIWNNMIVGFYCKIIQCGWRLVGKKMKQECSKVGNEAEWFIWSRGLVLCISLIQKKFNVTYIHIKKFLATFKKEWKLLLIIII